MLSQEHLDQEPCQDLLSELPEGNKVNLTEAYVPEKNPVFTRKISETPATVSRVQGGH